MNGYATARQNGWMSANDIRGLENLDRIPEEEGGDAYLVNGNMIPIQVAMKALTDEVDAEEAGQNEQQPLRRRREGG